MTNVTRRVFVSGIALRFAAILTSVMIASHVVPAASQTPATPHGSEVGMLTCQLSPHIGLIIGSHRSMACRFVPSGPYPQEGYVGSLDTIGFDVGITAGGVLVWGVIAPTAGPPEGGLAGVYLGGSGDISLGVGLGANVLFGGSGRTIALQPLSVSSEVGVSLAVGVAGLTLSPAP